MKTLSMFEVLCRVLNIYFELGETDVAFSTICNHVLFAENGYKYCIEETLRGYLGILHKNKKKKVFVRYSKKDDIVHIRRKIEDFKIANYRKL